MTPFSQKDSTIAALKQREVSLLEQLKFAVNKNDAKDEQVKLLREALGVCLEMAYCVDQYSTIESERKSEMAIIDKAVYLTSPDISDSEKDAYKILISTETN